jgi:hypothetical protein
VVDGEFLQLRIGLGAFVEAVCIARIVAGTDAGAADVQRHLAGSKELVHQFVALRLRNLAQNVTGRIGERRAEAQNLLAGCAGIESDGVGDGLGGGFPSQWRSLRMTPVAIGGPDLHRSG